VQLSGLPAPDRLEFKLPKGSVCVITDDGTPLTTLLAQTLSNHHWPVVILRLVHGGTPERPPLPANITTIAPADLSEASVAACFDSILRHHGPVAAFVHLQPAAPGALFSAEEKSSVKRLFLLAKQLSPSLHETALRGRGCFMTVTRLDGKLGLGHTPAFSAIGGGLFGLTKTLALEWPDVFCRAVDLSPNLSPTQAAEAIVAELHDPNRLIVETGWDAQGRVTLRA
jgi:NAD(P)-dependent dehydrogenase (short-subunit alcohol dehydrogenase family)